MLTRIRRGTVIVGVLMVLANVVPYILTRGTYETDGLEVAGWPLQFYAMGGLDGVRSFSPWKLGCNIVVALVAMAIAEQLGKLNTRDACAHGTLHAK